MARARQRSLGTGKFVGRVKIDDFPGYVPNVDPHDIPPGVAVIQVNAMSMKKGELRVRPGFVAVEFE